MNGSISREDGDVWDEGCETCQCKEGNVKCYKKPCPVINCKNPVLLEGQCCPICRSELIALNGNLKIILIGRYYCRAMSTEQSAL